jgi:hypothetical protein
MPVSLSLLKVYAGVVEAFPAVGNKNMPPKLFDDIPDVLTANVLVPLFVKANCPFDCQYKPVSGSDANVIDGEPTRPLFAVIVPNKLPLIVLNNAVEPVIVEPVIVVEPLSNVEPLIVVLPFNIVLPVTSKLPLTITLPIKV